MISFESTYLGESTIVGYSSGMRIQIAMSSKGFFFNRDKQIGLLVQIQPTGDYPPHPEISHLWEPLRTDGLSEAIKTKRRKWRAEDAFIIWYSDHSISLRDSNRDYLKPGDSDYKLVEEYVLKHISVAFDAKSFFPSVK
jgi:hypothetical protein